jgi:hypothetical protein
MARRKTLNLNLAPNPVFLAVGGFVAVNKVQNGPLSACASASGLASWYFYPFDGNCQSLGNSCIR